MSSESACWLLASCEIRGLAVADALVDSGTVTRSARDAGPTLAIMSRPEADSRSAEKSG